MFSPFLRAGFFLLMFFPFPTSSSPAVFLPCTEDFRAWSTGKKSSEDSFLPCLLVSGILFAPLPPSLDVAAAASCLYSTSSSPVSFLLRNTHPVSSILAQSPNHASRRIHSLPPSGTVLSFHHHQGHKLRPSVQVRSCMLSSSLHVPMPLKIVTALLHVTKHEVATTGLRSFLLDTCDHSTRDGSSS